MLRLRDQLQALRDLPVRVPERRTELLGAREGNGGRVLFTNEPSAGPGDVAGARVQDGHSAEGPSKRREVLRSERVRLEGLVERRVEVDDPGDVHDRANRPGKLAHEARRDAAERTGHIPVDRPTLSRKNASKPAPNERRSGLERIARRHLPPEALLGQESALFAHDEENAADVAKAIEQHRPEEFAEKPSPPRTTRRAPSNMRDTSSVLCCIASKPQAETSAMTIGGTSASRLPRRGSPRSPSRGLRQSSVRSPNPEASGCSRCLRRPR